MPNPGDIDGLFGSIANIINSVLAGGSSVAPAPTPTPTA